MQSGQAAAHLSRDEIADAIRSFTPAAWLRLKRVAARYARLRRVGEDDLLQEALTRALETRSCPGHVDVVRFIAEAIRSIAFDTAAKVENKVVLIAVAKTGDRDSEALTVADPVPSAETRMIDAEEEAIFRKAVLSQFDDDPVAGDIVEGTIEGMCAEELRELTGLDKTGYASKRRLIRRRLDKAFPEGWKP